ncbi:hypothetical protein GWI33_022125, partial [Rhynchophorus ferrugineus]
HRQKGYPHIHVPLKKKLMKRRTLSQDSTPQNTPAPTPKDSATATPSTERAPSPLSSLRSKIEDSETGPLNSPVFQEEDPGNQSSDSECVVSDPCNYHLNDEDDLQNDAQDKKVSFLNSENWDKFDPDGLKKK